MTGMIDRYRFARMPPLCSGESGRVKERGSSQTDGFLQRHQNRIGLEGEDRCIMIKTTWHVSSLVDIEHYLLYTGLVGSGQEVFVS